MNDGFSDGQLVELAAELSPPSLRATVQLASALSEARRATWANDLLEIRVDDGIDVIARYLADGEVAPGFRLDVASAEEFFVDLIGVQSNTLGGTWHTLLMSPDQIDELPLEVETTLRSPTLMIMSTQDHEQSTSLLFGPTATLIVETADRVVAIVRVDAETSIESYLTALAMSDDEPLPLEVRAVSNGALVTAPLGPALTRNELLDWLELILDSAVAAG